MGGGRSGSERWEVEWEATREAGHLLPAYNIVTYVREVMVPL